LASAGALILGCGFLGCSSQDSDPPPIAFPPAMDPVNGAGNEADPVDTETDPVDSETDPVDSEADPADSDNEGGPNVTDLDPGQEGEVPEGTEDPEETEEPEEVIEEPPPELTLPELVGDLDGHLFTVACGDTPNTDDCAGEGWRANGGQLNQCQGGRLEARIDFPIAGDMGAVYDLDLHFYGVMEPRNYGNQVMREAQGRPNAQPGGTPTPFASMQGPAEGPVNGATYLSTGDNNYNTYELHVIDPEGNTRFVHFLNADTQTGHYTFGIDYAKTLPVIGGGILRLQIADANCRQIKNCGAGGVPCVGKARTIDVSAVDPQPAAGTLQQPGLGKNPEHSGQWFLMDATGFVAR
jgi:hypothetical protein